MSQGQANRRQGRRRIAASIGLAALGVVLTVWVAPLVRRAYVIRELNSLLDRDGAREALAALPATWNAERGPDGEPLSVGFAEFQAPAATEWLPQRLGTAVLLRRGESSVVFAGAFRPSELRGSRLPGVESRMWRELLEIAGTRPLTGEQLRRMPESEFRTYAANVGLKVLHRGGVVGRLSTEHVDSLVFRAPQDRGPGLYAWIVSRTEDLGVVVHVRGGHEAEAEGLLRRVISTFRFVETGWGTEAELAEQIRGAIESSEQAGPGTE